MSKHGSDPEAEEEEKQKHSKKSVWDCGSSLYDSFELHTFSQQLRRAVSGKSASIIEDGRSRSLSMPHFVSTTDKEEAALPAFLHPKTRRSVLGVGIPRSLEKIFTRVFFLRAKTKSKNATSTAATAAHCL